MSGVHLYLHSWLKFRWPFKYRYTVWRLLTNKLILRRSGQSCDCPWNSLEIKISLPIPIQLLYNKRQVNRYREGGDSARTSTGKEDSVRDIQPNVCSFMHFVLFFFCPVVTYMFVLDLVWLPTQISRDCVLLSFPIFLTWWCQMQNSFHETNGMYSQWTWTTYFFSHIFVWQCRRSWVMHFLEWENHWSQVGVYSGDLFAVFFKCLLFLSVLIRIRRTTPEPVYTCLVLLELPARVT